MTGKVRIERLETGVPGLDEVLGGGLSEFSLNLIAGTPGSGKTTLAHQIMFKLATPQRPALYFTLLGEPPVKLLRYQQQYTFFDPAMLDDSVHYCNLSDELMHGDFAGILERISKEVERRKAALVFVESFRSVVGHVSTSAVGGRIDLPVFMQSLALQLAAWQATTFLIGEYDSNHSDENPVFTIADGILWLTQTVERNSTVRRLQASKIRGQAPLPGLHTFRIDDDGLSVFPRRPIRHAAVQRSAIAVAPRLSVGVPKLDELMGGGLPQGYSLLVTGPSGAGKTVLASSFLADGARRNETGILAMFETNPGRMRNSTLESLTASGEVVVFDTRTLDLSVDETLNALINLVRKTDAKRVVIDSISGFELSLAPSYREDFRESLYRLVAALMDAGTTVLLTCELEDRYGDLRFSPYGAAFLTDAIIVQRYVELNGALQRVLAVVKVRNSSHRGELYAYDITGDGLVIRAQLENYAGILTGSPREKH